MTTSNTDPGSQSVKEIEREVDAERKRVSDTIDALQEKVSVGNLVDQVMHSVGTHGGDAGRSLARAVRDNPLPLMLTGVGLAWLMASSGGNRRPEALYDDDLYEDDLYDDPYDAADPWLDRDSLGATSPYPGETGRGLSGTAPLGSGASAGTGSMGTDPTDLDTGSEKPGMGERMRGAAGAAGERMRGAAGAAGEQASAFGAGARDRASRTGDAVGSAAGSAARSVRRRTAAARRSALRGGREAQARLDDMLFEHPLVMGALALAAGAALGGALPRTRTEDEWMGAQSDRAKRAARSVAEDEGRKLQATAAAVADEAETMADEAAGGLDRGTPGGSDMVHSAEDRLGEAGRRLRDRAEEEANRQGLGQSVQQTGPQTSRSD